MNEYIKIAMECLRMAHGVDPPGMCLIRAEQYYDWALSKKEKSDDLGKPEVIPPVDGCDAG